MLLRGSPSGPFVFSGDGTIIFVDNPFAPDIRALGAYRQTGYDQIVESMVLDDSTTRIQLPRNAALDPLQVVLGPVFAGNTLEIDFSGTLEASTVGTQNGTFTAIPMVSFLPAPVFPGDFQVANNGFSSIFVPQDGVGGISQFDCIRGLVAVPIPADAAQCIIQIGYTAQELVAATNSWTVGGTDAKENGLSFILKATEIAASGVVQAGPGGLV